jgi:hypothetical protein
VEKAKREYEAKGQKRRTVVQWLNKLSFGIRYYSKVLDTLAQHHPEYVALAWGAVKFVIMVSPLSGDSTELTLCYQGIITHAELIEEFAKAMTLISDILAGVKLSSRLYQTEQMKETIARLYVHILLFFQQAVQWYTKSSAARALSSILKPFELGYQDTVDQIKLCAEAISNIAHGASQAELRDTHITVQLIHGNLQGMQKKLRGIQLQLEDTESRMTSHIDQVLQVAVANKTINEAVQLNVTDMKPRIYDLQFSTIFNMLSPKLSAEAILKKHMSQGKRLRHIWNRSIRNSADILKVVDLWISAAGCSLLILRSGPRAHGITRDHIVGLINYFRNIPQGVFWTLSPIGSCEHQPSTAGLLKSLIYQVISYDPNILLGFPENLSTLQFLDIRSENEWLDLLCLLISRLDKSVLIIEAENLYHASLRKREWTQEFLLMWKSIVDRVEATDSIVKVLVVTFDTNIQLLQDVAHNFVVTVQQPRTIPPRLRRGISQSKSKYFSKGLFMPKS